MKDDFSLLSHILDSIKRIEKYVEVGEKAFLVDTMVQDAVIRNFEVIGEAVKNLSDGLRDRSPTVPWKQISGMRDFLIHVYFGVKLETVWETVQDHPELRRVVEAELSALS